MKHDIHPERIYENDEVMVQRFGKDFANFKRALRRRGFRLSKGRQFFFHPDHWKEVPQVIVGAGGRLYFPRADIWCYEDQARARTKAAKEWLKREE